MAADPTYPLSPIANIIAAALLSLVLLSSAVRRSWNLGLAILCFWLFLEALTNGIGGIIWANNAEIKLHVYCDITSRVQIIALVVKPMAIFILMRRLHKISGFQTTEMRMRRANWRELWLEWTLGFAIPVVVAGPLYYIVEPARFQLLEGFGCTNAIASSVLSILLLGLWGVIPPLLCVILYYPRVVRVFYHQSRSIRRFQNGNTYPFRTTYFRILAIASIDLLLTLPIGIATLALAIATFRNLERSLNIPFYQGWSVVHRHFQVPVSTSYAELREHGTYNLAEAYFTYWTTPVLAFSIFGLFGLTAEARASYGRVCSALSTRLRGEHHVSPRKRDESDLESLEFDIPPREMSLDTETGSFPVFVAFTPSVAAA
ncbi:hypothetical protein PENSPDRAFT_685563 [Peniophora sp. CONT]|nr:hypothetical protein PENSPDRAFT_685563 [Peniophora sp. CONT]